MMFRITPLLAVGAVVLVAATAATAQPVETRHATAELVADVSTIQPGHPFTVGLRLVMEKGWHTYWKNPGDAGMATSIRWELPEGFTAGEIAWPVPHLLGEAPEMSYGYEGELLLPVTITPPSDIPSGSSLVLRAHAAWLICEEICISDKADLTLTLATDTKAPAPSGWADLFRKTQQLLPKALAGMKLSASRAGDSYVLNITPDKPVADGAEFMFFAGEEEVINHSALQKQSTDGRTVQLLLRDSDYASKPASRLRGVLVVTGGEKHEKERKAFSIDLPVDGVADATAD